MKPTLIVSPEVAGPDTLMPERHAASTAPKVPVAAEPHMTKTDRQSCFAVAATRHQRQEPNQPGVSDGGGPDRASPDRSPDIRLLAKAPLLSETVGVTGV
jgi:hypothetical protein